MIGHAVQLAVALGRPLAAILVVFLVLFELERRGHGVTTVVAVVLTAVFDAAVYPDTDATTDVSIFHPTLHGHGLRTMQVLIPLALAARFAARRQQRLPSGSAALWWAGFLLWYATQAVVGLVAHHPGHLVLGEASAVIYVGGTLVLAAGVPARDYLSAWGLPLMVRVSAVVAMGLLVADKLHIQIHHNLPYLPLTSVGTIGADAATLFVTIGLVGGAVELTRARRRMDVLLGSCVLVISHLFSEQRAARLGFGVAVVVIAVALMSARGRRRFSVTGAETAFLGLALASALALPVFAAAVAGSPKEESITKVVTPIAGETLTVLSPHYHHASVQSRYNQWSVVTDMIAHHPVAGTGLGTTFIHYEVGIGFPVQDIAHNIGLDLTMRTGAVGMLLFLGAVLASCAPGWAVWRHGRDGPIAALGMIAVATFVGLLAKGMVESIFDKYRLAILIGMLPGIALAAARDGLRRGADDPAEPAAGYPPVDIVAPRRLEAAAPHTSS